MRLLVGGGTMQAMNPRMFTVVDGVWIEKAIANNGSIMLNSNREYDYCT